jgi:glycosyltransferase involved in cell wall biosynthesis
MKICLVSPYPPPYGGIAHWTSLIHRFAQVVDNVDFVQVDTAPRWRATYDHAVGKRVLGGAIQFIQDYGRFLWALRQKPDVIHLTTSGSLAAFRDLVIGMTARLWGIPCVYHIRFGRVPEIAAANTFEWRLLARVMRLASVVMVITPETAVTIKRCLPDVCVEYIPNPIDLSTLPTPTPQSQSARHNALFLGWILPAKGVAELIQAWAELCPPDWDLWLVGPGEVEYQQSLINHYRPQNVRFVGELTHDEAMQVLARADLFVLPSYTEGFPNVILEAMALGKPIVATNVGAIHDMLSNDNGLLIEPKDVNGLKEALTRLIRDEDLRRELGVKVYNKVRQEYSIDAIFARYTQTWQSLKRSNT